VVKGSDIALNGTHLKAMERHVPHGITQCYLLPDTGERAPPYRPVLYLPTPEGWKAELISGGWLHAEMVYLPAGSHPSQY